MKQFIGKLLGKSIDVLEKRAARKRQERMPFRRKTYSAAQVSQLFTGWITHTTDINEDVKKSIRPIRARARDLVRNNVYARKFLHMVGTNVVGPKGVRFQSKVKTTAGKLDISANRKIEAAWKDWGKRKNASVTGKMSWLEMQHIFIKTIARDGECLIRKIKNKKFKYGIALQLIDVDHLDENYNDELPNGNIVRMGIEFNKWNAPVAYWINKKSDPVLPGYTFHTERERIPADEIIHGFRPEYPEQVRDVSWLATGATDVKMLDGYKESAVVAARIGASKMGFIFTPTGNEYQADDKDEKGNVITEVEPGSIEQLPAGWEFKAFDPKSNTGDMEPFMRSNVQGLASGWNVSYISLSSDMKGVSYATDRSSKIEERDNWMVIQEFLIEILCEDVFEEWLDMALTCQALPLPPSKYEKFNSPRFQPKRWKWIDPKKDQDANRIALENKTTSRGRIAEEAGEDIEEIFDELAWEEEEIVRRKIGAGGQYNAEN